MFFNLKYCTKFNVFHCNEIFNFMHIFPPSARFGLHYVDFDDANRTRTPKDSAIQLTKIFADNGFPEPSSGIITAIPNQVALIVGFVVFAFRSIFFIEAN